MALWGQILATVASSTIVAAGSAGAQWSASLDAGVANVTYEGYLAAAAATIAPTATWMAGRVSVAADGALTRFETGHVSGAADLGARWLVLASQPIHIDLLADENASRYQNAPLASRTRLGSAAAVPAGGFTLFGSASLGQLVQDGRAQPVTELAIAAEHVIPVGAIDATLTQHWVGTVPYADLEAAARFDVWRITAGAVAGARAISTLSGRQAWAHVDVAFRITPGLAATAGLGSYPRDLTVNAPGAGYLSVGLRLHASSRPPVVSLPWPPARASDGGTPASARDSASGTRPGTDRARSLPTPVPAPEDAPFATVTVSGGRSVVLRISAPGAANVGVRGDFTEWRARSMDPAPDGSWSIRIVPGPGIHWFQVSVDGRPWVAPTGVTPTADDFGGSVGLFVTP